MSRTGDGGDDAADLPQDVLQVILDTVRTNLGMEVGYLSEFVGGMAVFRVVSAPGLEHMIRPQQSLDIRSVYCKHILDGGLPRLIPDTSEHEIATALPITQAVPIGSHVSVPVYREDGSVYGMFCCLSRSPNGDLGERDLHVMETFARLAQDHLDKASGG